MTVDPFAAVIGQDAAVARLRRAADRPSHAYLFVGPRGSGKLAAAWAFAGEVLARSATDGAAAERFRRLAHERKLADVEIIEPEGQAFRKPEAETLRSSVHSSPIESTRHVTIATQFHTTTDEAVSLMLKSIEEPPPSALLILLAEDELADFPTIRSRCQLVEFVPVAAGLIVDALTSAGVERDLATTVAAAAGGNIDRARLLATDPEFLARRDRWAAAPDRLDHTGATVAALVSEIRAGIDQAVEPLRALQAEEVAEMDRREEELGTRGSGRAAMVEAHKRQERLIRTDELRFGMATLAAHYRTDIDIAPDAAARVRALARINRFIDMMERNPIEALQLEALFLDLDS